MRPWYMLWYISRCRRYAFWYSPTVMGRVPTSTRVAPAPRSATSVKAGMYRMMKAAITNHRKPYSHRRWRRMKPRAMLSP